MIWPTISHTPKNKQPITVFKNSIDIGRDLPKSEKPPSVVVDLDPPSRSPSCERVVSTRLETKLQKIFVPLHLLRSRQSLAATRVSHRARNTLALEPRSQLESVQ